MINHHTILKQQLKKIFTNLNKKYTTLRKEVQKTLQVFENQQIPVFPYQVCFSLFRQVSQTGSVSSSLAFMPFLLNIINLGFSNAEMSREILTLLLHTKSIPKFGCFQNQSRMQQVLAILVSKNCIDLRNLSFTHSLFNIVLSLQNTRYKGLWLKSSTILYQTLQLLINDLRYNPTQQNMQSLQKFMRQLIKATSGQPPQWLLEYTDSFLIFHIFAETLDDKYLIENTEAHFKGVFTDLLVVVRKELRKCIENGGGIGMLVSRVESGTGTARSWQLSLQNKVIILMRVSCKIAIITKRGFQLLEQIIKIISQKRPTSLKPIAYQSTNYLFRNSTWLLNLFQSQFADLFNFLLTTEFNTIKYLLSQQKDKIDLTIYMTSNNQTMYSEQRQSNNGQSHSNSNSHNNSNNYNYNYNKIMGSNGIDIGIGGFDYSHQVKFIVKNLEEVTYGLYAIYCQKFKIDMNEKIEGKPPLQKTYKFCQKTVFQTIKTIISRQMSQDTLQSLLKISQKFINLSGCFNDPSVSAIYIKLMCKYCLPSQFKLIDHRHIQINKMILNTANCLGHLFTSSCWVIVWKTLQNYSIYYNRYLLGKEQLQSARESDVQILYKSMDSIFTESPKYNDKYLLEVIRSLVEVAYQCLENNYNDQTRKIFAFERIQQIYKLNLTRICIIWPQLSSSLLCITTSKVLYFRLSALGLLNSLIPLSLNYLKTHQQHLSPPFTPTTYQQLLLQPWINLVSCQFQQIKDQFLLAVNKLIIDYGHIMTNGWKCIMQIIKKTNDLKSLQAIVQTFLEKVHDYIMDVVISVDTIERKLVDTNQKYLCLTMIWAIADYARKNQMFEVLKKIYHVLLVPEEMFNLGTEARHSSFYIFAEIVVHNCAQKSPQFWDWIFEQIKKFYTYGINQCRTAKNKTFSEQALKNLLTNLIKIYKKLFLVSKQWSPTNPLHHKLLSNFYSFCSSILQFRSPQIYQNIIKQSKQILTLKIKQSLQIQQFYTFLENIAQIYYVQNDSKILKCLITYLPADIYDVLGVCVDGLRVQFIVMYRLMEKVFLLRLEAYEKDIKLQQLRIFFQQKYHYEYLKKVQTYLFQQSTPPLTSLYIQNLCKTIHKLKLYQDYNSLIKTLPYLINIHKKYLDQQQKMILETLKEIIKTRNQENWIKLMNSNVKDIPIWYVCILQLCKIGFLYIDGRANKKQEQEDKEGKAESKQENKQLTIGEGGFDNVSEVYNIVYGLINQNLSQNIQRFSKEGLGFYYQSEIQMCYFLFQNYYYSPHHSQNSSTQHIETLSKLLKSRSQDPKSSDPTKKSQNAYKLLFKLSAQRQQYKNASIQKNQSIIIGCLIQRILQTFQKIKIGKNHDDDIEELRFVIKAMIGLKIRKGCMLGLRDVVGKVIGEGNCGGAVLGLADGHLFLFQKWIAKCVRCQDPEALQLIQNYLQKVSSSLLSVNSFQ